MATRFQHADGRVCQQERDECWVYNAPTQTSDGFADYTCPRSHENGVNGLMLESPKERGDLGMPTLGFSPGKVFETPVGFKMTINATGMTLDYGENGVKVPAATDEAVVILTKVLPDLLKMFLEKNAQYARAQTGHDLGIKGIIPDINRKSAAIISRVWDADNAWSGGDTDSTEELCRDLVGHLLLVLAKLREAE